MGYFRDIVVVLFMLSTVMLYMFFRFEVFQMGSFSLYFRMVLLMYSFS